MELQLLKHSISYVVELTANTSQTTYHEHIRPVLLGIANVLRELNPPFELAAKDTEVLVKSILLALAQAHKFGVPDLSPLSQVWCQLFRLKVDITAILAQEDCSKIWENLYHSQQQPDIGYYDALEYNCPNPPVWWYSDVITNGCGHDAVCTMDTLCEMYLRDPKKFPLTQQMAERLVIFDANSAPVIDMLRPICKDWSRISDAQFNLEVCLEVIDHSDLNWIEETYLAQLLHASLRNIIHRLETDLTVTDLHLMLGNMGCVWSLPSALYMTQFIITRWILRFHNHHNLPVTDVLPTIPPIARSTFCFTNQIHTHSPTRLLQNLFGSLVQLHHLQHALCQEYSSLSNVDQLHTRISYMTLVGTANLSTQFLATVLTTSPMLSPCHAEHLQMLSLQSIQDMLHLHAGYGLYHLIALCEEISLRDLSWHQMCFDTLKFILPENLNLLSELSLNKLVNFLNTWNDGTEEYSSLYKSIEYDQPPHSSTTFSLNDIMSMLPSEFDIGPTSSNTPTTTGEWSSNKASQNPFNGAPIRQGRMLSVHVDDFADK